MKNTQHVLFVCTGNICRSPLAEAYLKKLLHKGGPPNVRVSSAGIYAIPGNTTPPEGIETASQIGLDLGSHRARPLTREIVNQADLIVVMAPEHADFILSSYPEASKKVEFMARYAIGTEDDTIPDPLGGSAFHYRSAYAVIAKAVQAIYDQKISKAAPMAEPRPNPPQPLTSAKETIAITSQAPTEKRRISVLVPASSANLGPGFDALGLALQLYNRVIIEEAQTDEVHITGEGEDTLPSDATNIVLQAIESTFALLKIKRPPLRLTLENAIPLARGLGSSAAARVGGLVAARLWCGLPVAPIAVLKQAETLEGHADNAAPSLLGGLTVVAGTGENLRVTRAVISEKIQISLVIPDFEVSTPEARKALPKDIPHSDAVFNVQRTALLMAALAAGDGHLLPLAMQDRLHQPHRAHLMGPIREAFAAGRKAGAAGVALSGAGPTIVALSIAGEANPAEIAEAMVTPYQERQIGCTPLVLNVDTQGARLEGP